MSPCSCTRHGLNSCNWLGKPCVCGISEWMMSAPITETGLALVAVDFGGKYTQELGQVRV